MKRPYILCNMIQTIDGKSNGNFFKCPECRKACIKCFQYHADFLKNGYSSLALGRIALEKEFTKGFKPDYSKYKEAEIKYEDFIPKTECKRFLIGYDRKGVLGWQTSTLKGSFIKADSDAQIVEILTEKAPKEHVAYLKDIGVAIIFAGKDNIDINLSLEKLKNYFGIEKLLLSGGATINGAFLKEGCVDEISLIIASMTGDTEDRPLFTESVITQYKLSQSQTFVEDNYIWLDYVKK